MVLCCFQIVKITKFFKKAIIFLDFIHYSQSYAFIKSFCLLHYELSPKEHKRIGSKLNKVSSIVRRKNTK